MNTPTGGLQEDAVVVAAASAVEIQEPADEDDERQSSVIRPARSLAKVEKYEE